MADSAEAFPNAWGNYTRPAEKKGKGGGKGKGGKGKGKGKGQRHNAKGGHDAPRAGRADWDDEPDFEVIEDARRAELEAQVVGYRDGGPRTEQGYGDELSFPTTLTPLERRFVYSVVERLGDLTARGVGPKADRRIVVTRGAPLPTNAQAAANGTAHSTDDVNPERRAELELQLQSLLNGTEPCAIPRKGDKVQVTRVLGADPRHLEGRVGEVVGVAPSETGDSAYTVWFVGDGAAFGEDGLKLTFCATDLRVHEAVRPLDEGCLKLPSTLTGLERKVVHELAETLGLTSQSFGERQERYITVYRAAASASAFAANASMHQRQEGDSTDTSSVRNSGVELDEASTALLLCAVAGQLTDCALQLPERWRPLAKRMIICNGPLRQPLELDQRRQSPSDVFARISALWEGEEVELRVVSLGRDKRAIAVGVLGVPAAARNPNVAVAVAPSEPPYAADCIAQWTPWHGPALVLKGKIVQWRQTELGQVEAAAEATPATNGTHDVGSEGAEVAASTQPSRIRVRTTTPGEEWLEEWYPVDAISDFKQRIANGRPDNPVGLQRLVHMGRILPDDVMLTDLHLSDGDYFVLVVQRVA